MSEPQNIHKIIQLLADGQFHSGADIGHMLGITRAAVWKTCKQIIALGLPLVATHGKGYCFTHPIDWLNYTSISNALPSQISKKINTLEIFPTLPSTNQYLLDQFQQQRALPLQVCLAEQQTQGRGRGGRTWHAPMAATIALSVLWQSDRLSHPLQGLSLATGVAIAQALQAYGIPDIGLKWPNDLMYQGRKLGGILLEITGEAHGQQAIILGIGLNTDLSGYKIENLSPHAITDIAQITGQPCARNTLVALLLSATIDMLSLYAEQGFAPFLAPWQQYDAYQDQLISFHHAQGIQHGIARGIDPQGALIIEDSAGARHRFYSGDIHTLRLDIPKANDM